MEPPGRESAALLEQLYSAATCGIEWHEFLRDYAAEFEADGVVLVDAPDEPQDTPALAACYGFHTDLTPLARDLALRYVSTQASDGTAHDTTYVCESVRYDASRIDARIRQQLLEPAGLERCYFLQLLASRSPTHHRCVTAMRRQEAGPFTESDIRRAAMLAPHIDRAVTLYAANSRRDLERTAALWTLDWLGVGITIVAEDGSVRYLNEEARQIFALDDGLSLSANHIHCADPDASRQLDSQIRRAVGEYSSEDQAGDHPVRVERKSGLSAFALFVIPAPQPSFASAGNGACRAIFASVLVSNPERPMELPPIALRKLYGITPAEARVLEGIVAGSTVSELAQRLEVTANTIRAHLKHIYRITRTKNQADLIRRVMLDIAWLKSASRRDD